MTAQSTLTKIPARLTSRCLTQAIKAASEARGIDFLECEEKYTSARSALAHLAKHDRYRTHIEDRIHDLVQKTRHLLTLPGVERLSKDPNWVSELAEATDALERDKDRELERWAIRPEDVAIFLDVVEETRATYIRLKYDPSDVVAPNIYVLATLARGNFAAYEKTLNS